MTKIVLKSYFLNLLKSIANECRENWFPQVDDTAFSLYLINSKLSPDKYIRQVSVKKKIEIINIFLLRYITINHGTCPTHKQYTYHPTRKYVVQQGIRVNLFLSRA